MKSLKNKKFLIFGGTGSFGNAVLRKLLDLEVSKVRVFSRDEKKQHDMRIAINDERLEFVIGDVRNFDSVIDSMSDIDFIFFAAALKQVPSCEFHPMEAIKTNVLGAENVIRAAIQKKIKKCIFLSTDKAVYPINSMGLSKAMMEKVMIAASRNCDPSETILCATRYGNVMGSRGSVIPLFIEQLKNNSEITITDPSMTRFLMSLEESVELVLYAFDKAENGDIFVQKSPACTIQDLAQALKNIMNLENKIKIIGTRHGEKLFESLVSREEMSKAVDLGSYFRIPIDNRNLNYSKYFSEGNEGISTTEDYTSHNTQRLNVSEVEELLKKINLV